MAEVHYPFCLPFLLPLLGGLANVGFFEVLLRNPSLPHCLDITSGLDEMFVLAEWQRHGLRRLGESCLLFHADGKQPKQTW